MGAGGAEMILWRRTVKQLPLMIIWLILSIIFWGWIYTHFIMDTVPQKKISVAVDAQLTDARQMAHEIENNIPDYIKMCKVYSFDYAMMDSTNVLNADILIIPEKDMPEYIELLAPVPGELISDSCYQIDSIYYGILCCNEQFASASRYINYIVNDADRTQNYYLCFGKNGYHLYGNPVSTDNISIAAASIILSMK